MKLNILQVVTLCACLGQIHSWSNELPADMKNQLKDVKFLMMHAIYNISEQFVDDFIHIVEMTRGDVNRVQSLVMQNGARIDADYIKRYQCSYCEPVCVTMDNLKILQSVLSERVTPELMNLLYVFKYPNATSAQIESALNYFHGIDDVATRTSFLNPLDFPDPSAKDCPYRDQMYTILFDKLRVTIDLRPKVIQNITAIREKFPCNSFVLAGLNNFVNVITKLNGDKSKIGACMLKENPGNWEGNWTRFHIPTTRVYREYLIEGFESALFTRVSDETGRGIINLLKANIPGTSIEDIEKALKYLYDVVPETRCT